MAQLAEQLICNQQVIGSSPIIGLTLLKRNFNIAGWSSLEARRAHNPKVAGSNPAPATQTFIVYAQIAQLVRAPPCHGGGREFESLLGRYGIIAQLGEHLPYKQRVIGSSPIGPITT